MVVALFALASFGPLRAFLDAHSGWTALGGAGKPVAATTFTLNIFSAGGTVLLVSGLVTAAIYRLHPRRLVRAFADVVVQSANSLFGLLQTTAAARTGISPILLGAANTSGGVLGKMISPQNLAIGAAVVGMTGRESELFRKVVGWSLVLLLGMSLLVFLQSTPVLGWMVVAR